MKRMTLRVIPALLLTAFSGTTLASGFALQNQTGSSNGNAFAGAAAAAEDAGTIFFNPAGLTHLPEGQNIAVAATLLKRSIKFTDTGTNSLNPTVTSTNGGDGGGTSIIPAVYWSKSVKSDLSVGLGISPTFGNKTEYTTDFQGRYSGYFAEMKQTNINPTLAYQANEKLSLGLGLNFAKNETEFRQTAPIYAGTVALPPPAPYPDSNVTLKGDGAAWGYNFGLIFNVSDATRLGVSYRSKLKFDLDGTQTASPAYATLSLPASVGIKATLETPDTLSLALSQQINQKLQLLADATWTGWSSVNHIAVTRADGVAHSGLTYNFDDSYRVGLGANYELNESWKLRGGLALDKTPVRGASDTTMTLPDSDRTWISIGAKYTVSKVNSIDVGYTHILFKEATTQRAIKNSSGTTVQTIRGNFDTSADLLSVQYNRTL